MNIICILGYTASGKDTIVNNIFEKYNNIKKNIPVTTRPPRNNEKNGIDYFFYDNDYFEKESHNLISKRSYTVWDGSVWKYAFMKDMFKGGEDIVLATDIEGYNDLKNEFKKDNIIGIFLDVPITILIQRLEERNTPKEEIERRLKDDMLKYGKFLFGGKGEGEIFIVKNSNLQIAMHNIEVILKYERR